MSGWQHRLLISGLHLVPKAQLSRCMGAWAGVKLPGPFARAQVHLFAKMAGVDLSEIQDPLEAFDSLQSFFTRELKAGCRPIDQDPSHLTSPCDGAWGMSGPIQDGKLYQVKGRAYELDVLLGDQELASVLNGGSYATLYLSPKDYHRFHMPCAGQVIAAAHLPGRLWPVNMAGLHHVDKLFAVNERIVVVLRPDASPKKRMVLVAVGATMVGKVKITFDDLATNQAGAVPIWRSYEDRNIRFEKGEEWGHFAFGSTIVMALEPGLAELEYGAEGLSVRLGESIGTFGPDSGLSDGPKAEI